MLWRGVSRACRRWVHSRSPDRTQPPQTTPEETLTTSSAVPNDLKEPDLLRAAFRDLHAARLHGFALLVTFGDRARAAQAAANTMATGSQRAAELRHPERAAAWLRREVLKELRHTPASRHLTPAERHAALLDLGAAEPAIAALGDLTSDRRAALVAGIVERFALTDVATILDTNLVGAQRALHSARRAYQSAAAHWMHELPNAAMAGGALADRIDHLAALAVGPRRNEA
jgi:DNA-directed RNA polymerase specialized sigma24 family protein